MLNWIAAIKAAVDLYFYIKKKLKEKKDARQG